MREEGEGGGEGGGGKSFPVLGWTNYYILFVAEIIFEKKKKKVFPRVNEKMKNGTVGKKKGRR